MRDRRSHFVGVLVLGSFDWPGVHTDNHTVLQGINLVLEESGYVPAMVRIADMDEQDAVRSRVFSMNMLDGLLVLGGVSEQV